MKRLLIILALLVATPSMHTYAKPPHQAKNKTLKKSYEELHLVEATTYDVILEQFYNVVGRILYKGINTDDKYYFKDLQGRYYPLKENSIKTYKGQDVSFYKWVCDYGEIMEFTNMVRI